MARLLEHHTLELLDRGGVAVPRFRIAASAEAAGEASAALGGSVVLKALIPVGGRGKAGAIRKAGTPDQAAAVARELLGRTVLNFPVERLLVSAPVAIAQELFVAITFDSMSRKPIVLFSDRGGIDVEAILERDPASSHEGYCGQIENQHFICLAPIFSDPWPEPINHTRHRGRVTSHPVAA